MKTNDKDIEKMAAEVQMAQLACYVGDEFSRESMRQISFHSAKAGFKACEAMMVESAASDFQKWGRDYFGATEVCIDYLIHVQKAFTAGAMSQAKRDAEEINRTMQINEGLGIRISKLEQEIQKLKDDLEKQTNARKSEERARQFYVDQVIKLKADRGVMVSCLKWYGDKKNISFMDCAHIEINDEGEELADNGYRARQALKSTGEIE
jgi:hypothetical protein